MKQIGICWMEFVAKHKKDKVKLVEEKFFFYRFDGKLIKNLVEKLRQIVSRKINWCFGDFYGFNFINRNCGKFVAFWGFRN